MTERLTPLYLYSLGYPVIPSGGGPQGKSPLVEWAQYQKVFPDENDIIFWESTLHPSLWGITTGQLADVVIIDLDRPELKDIFEKHGLSPHIQTPRGGYHFWFRYPGHHVKTVAGLLPSIDVRGDGGFVNVIGKRSDGEYKTLITPTPETIYAWDKLPPEIIEALKKDTDVKKTPNPVSIAEIIPEGQRNDTLTREAGKLRRCGMSETTIFAALVDINNTRCNPPLPEKEIASISKSVCRYLPDFSAKNNMVTLGRNVSILTSEPPAESERYKSVTKSVTEKDFSVTAVTREKVEEWIRETTAWFSYEEIDRELNIHSEDAKRNRRVIFKRLKDEGVIEAHPKDNKLYRFVNVNIRLIDFRNAKNKTPLDIFFPFGIESYINTYPGNLIVLAGAPNAGKTAFLLNFIRQNMDKFAIFYQSSEMGEDELAIRLEKFKDITLDGWNFTPEERSSEFQDVIRPDCINIIDYMELTDNFYQIGGFLSKIHDKLSTGIAIVAIQKNPNVDLGRGGNLGTEKPRLYLSMDAGKLKIVKGKNWANPMVNPNRLEIKFNIFQGCEFSPIGEWHHEDEAPL